jgi:hypothetical protein
MDPLYKRLSNSTRARFAREGGRDLTEHASTRDQRACVFREIPPPSSRPFRPAPRRIHSRSALRSVDSGGSVAPFRDPLPRLPPALRSNASNPSLERRQPFARMPPALKAPELQDARLPHTADAPPAKSRGEDPARPSPLVVTSPIASEVAQNFALRPSDRIKSLADLRRPDGIMPRSLPNIERSPCWERRPTESCGP